MRCEAFKTGGAHGVGSIHEIDRAAVEMSRNNGTVAAHVCRKLGTGVVRKAQSTAKDEFAGASGNALAEPFRGDAIAFGAG